MENIPNLLIPQSATINDFPGEILIHILSFLPIKYVFRTSIISKRWVPLCYSLSVIRVDDDGMNNAEEWIHFRQMVATIMLSPRSQDLTLKSLYLKFRSKLLEAEADCFSFDKRVEAAKQPRVEYLNLLLVDIPLAPTIFCCKTLVVLRLMKVRHIATLFHCPVDLPLLKSLFLYAICFKEKPKIDGMFEYSYC